MRELLTAILLVNSCKAYIIKFRKYEKINTQ